MAWSEHDKAIIKARVESGERPSVIARDYKTTKNAIVGLIHRCGWISPHQRASTQAKMHTDPQIQRGPGYRVNKLAMRRMRISGPNFVRELEVIETAVSISTTETDAQIPMQQRKQIMGLKDRDCRWPVGDPHEAGFFFCGRATVNDKPYCAFHCRAAYIPQASRAGQFALRPWKTSPAANRG